jgi:hypothetical protein
LWLSRWLWAVALAVASLLLRLRLRLRLRLLARYPLAASDSVPVHCFIPFAAALT